MALILMGKKAIDFTNDKGERIQGIKLHCVEQASHPTEGRLSELIFVPIDKPLHSQVIDLPFGTLFIPVYNKRGKVDDILVKELPGGLDPNGNPLPKASDKPGK